MKLSEAIRAGAKIRPQNYGDFYGTTPHRFSWRCLVGLCKPAEKTSCALGAAMEAIDCPTEKRVNESEFIGRDGKVVTAGERVFRVPPTEWYQALYSEFLCPQCEREGQGLQLIPHLNDDHRWTREEIAVFVERCEARAAVIIPLPSSIDLIDVEWSEMQRTGK